MGVLLVVVSHLVQPDSAIFASYLTRHSERPAADCCVHVMITSLGNVSCNLSAALTSPNYEDSSACTRLYRVFRVLVLRTVNHLDPESCQPICRKWRQFRNVEPARRHDDSVCSNPSATAACHAAVAMLWFWFCFDDPFVTPRSCNLLQTSVEPDCDAVLPLESLEVLYNFLTRHEPSWIFSNLFDREIWKAAERVLRDQTERIPPAVPP